MIRCARCDWTADPDSDLTPRAQLALHALDSGHPLCPCCARSLTRTDPPFGCETCLTDARATLSGIVTLYAELPSHLGHLHGGLGGHSGSEPPLVGGTVLVLLAAGSAGYDEDGTTSHDDDPPSIAFELDWWWRDWQESRNEPVSIRKMTPTRLVLKAAGYLETRMRWAATNHPAFDEFARDLKRLHRALERAVGDAPRMDRANAACFDCGAELIRDMTVVAKHAGKHQDGPLRMGPVPTEQENYTCRGCDRTYDQDAYARASTATVEQHLGWVPLREASRRSLLPFRTVQTWANREQVMVRVQDGRRQVWWPEIREKTREAS